MLTHTLTTTETGEHELTITFYYGSNDQRTTDVQVFKEKGDAAKYLYSTKISYVKQFYDKFFQDISTIRLINKGGYFDTRLRSHQYDNCKALQTYLTCTDSLIGICNEIWSIRVQLLGLLPSVLSNYYEPLSDLLSNLFEFVKSEIFQTVKQES